MDAKQRYFQIPKLGKTTKCEFEGKLTAECENCGQPHKIIPAEFDCLEIKESIRIIDSHRDRLIDKLHRMRNSKLAKSEIENFDANLETIRKEMNEAVEIICAQNDLYGYKFK